MVEKLKSISKQIHWSLLLKAAVFALTWLLLPFWLFFLVALYLYFIPLFRSWKLLPPFFGLFLLTYLQTPGIFFALVFGALFYLIFLVRDLLVIDRRSAYELLVLALSFFLLRGFYMTFNKGIGGAVLFWTFPFTALLAFLLGSFFSAFNEGIRENGNGGIGRIAVMLSFLLLFQAIIICLFLPLDFIYQFTLAFLFVVLLTDLVPAYLFVGASRTKILTTAMTILGLFVIILGSARWGL